MPALAPAIEQFIKAERAPLPQVMAALRNVGPLEGMDDRDYEWLALHGTEYFVPAGELIFRKDQPSEYMSILLEGEIQVRPGKGRGGNLFIGRAGEITGLIPYSRMKAHGGDGIAVVPTWMLVFHKSEFSEMLENVPALSGRLVSVMLDRVREVTRMEQQAEKLSALNKLAGNLSHELNNPASAAQRSASHLLEELNIYGKQKFALGLLCLSQEKLTELRNWEDSVTRRQVSIDDQNALHQADRESELQQWLDSREIAAGSDSALMLSESGVKRADLDSLASQTGLDPAALGTYLAQFTSSLRTRRMTEAVLHSTERIFEIINAVKDYSYLDQAALQQVDVPQSLRSALAMLQSRLNGIEIVEDFAEDLPRITAFGSELNLVWTALFENALDAMGSAGRLEVTARHDPEWVTVEITDNGGGIPAELRSRIFEPFFTTKPPGKALGLGLDIAMRIIRKHRGHITVTSQPGRTCFQVKLPFDQGRAY